MRSPSDAAGCNQQLAYDAPAAVQQFIAAMGRIEDARFSPDFRRLALADFSRDCICIFDIDIRLDAKTKRISLCNASALTAPELKSPHGLDFIDAETLVVANRNGSVCVLQLPVIGGCLPPGRHQAAFSHAFESPLLHAPGSLTAWPEGVNGAAILVCNNSGHSITRHTLDFQTRTLLGSEVLLEKWLDIPDGISLGSSRQWIAVSNHGMHCCVLYRNTPDLHPQANPQAILLGCHYPHGIRMTADDRYILVADAGTPFVHIYARPDNGWAGLQYPSHSLRVMDATTFTAGRLNPQEGGPKGIDLHHPGSILVTSCTSQPLAFFDLARLLGQADSSTTTATLGASTAEANMLNALDVLQELEWLAQRARAETAQQQLDAVLQSHSWRLVAPLRWLGNALRRIRQA